MVNLFTAAGPINYAKSKRLFLDLMTNLSWQQEQFEANGYHTVKRSNRFWAGIWTDLSIEQILMRA